jgi:hypothetical protein
MWVDDATEIKNVKRHGHIDCLVTQMIGTYITGGSGYTGDFLNDWAFEPSGARPRNVMIVGHCGAPITPFGHDKLPYLIRDHIHNKAFGPEDTPTATTLRWPPNEDATIVKGHLAELWADENRLADNRLAEDPVVVPETGEIAFLGGHDEVRYDSDDRECRATRCAMRPRASWRPSNKSRPLASCWLQEWSTPGKWLRRGRVETTRRGRA